MAVTKRPTSIVAATAAQRDGWVLFEIFPSCRRMFVSSPPKSASPSLEGHRLPKPLGGPACTRSGPPPDFLLPLVIEVRVAIWPKILPGRPRAGDDSFAACRGEDSCGRGCRLRLAGIGVALGERCRRGERQDRPQGHCCECAVHSVPPFRLWGPSTPPVTPYPAKVSS